MPSHYSIIPQDLSREPVIYSPSDPPSSIGKTNLDCWTRVRIEGTTIAYAALCRHQVRMNCQEDDSGAVGINCVEADDQEDKIEHGACVVVNFKPDGDVRWIRGFIRDQDADPQESGRWTLHDSHNAFNKGFALCDNGSDWSKFKVLTKPEEIDDPSLLLPGHNRLYGCEMAFETLLPLTRLKIPDSTTFEEVGVSV